MECKLSQKSFHLNTDASTVEDIKHSPNLKNVCCCLALHLLKIGPISFALDHSSVAVSESISIPMTNLLDAGLPVLVPDISLDFLT